LWPGGGFVLSGNQCGGGPPPGKNGWREGGAKNAPPPGFFLFFPPPRKRKNTKVGGPICLSGGFGGEGWGGPVLKKKKPKNPPKKKTWGGKFGMKWFFGGHRGDVLRGPASKTSFGGWWGPGWGGDVEKRAGTAIFFLPTHANQAGIGTEKGKGWFGLKMGGCPQDGRNWGALEKFQGGRSRCGGGGGGGGGRD